MFETSKSVAVVDINSIVEDKALWFWSLVPITWLALQTVSVFKRNGFQWELPYLTWAQTEIIETICSNNSIYFLYRRLCSCVCPPYHFHVNYRYEFSSLRPDVNSIVKARASGLRCLSVWSPLTLLAITRSLNNVGRFVNLSTSRARSLQHSIYKN